MRKPPGDSTKVQAALICCAVSSRNPRARRRNSSSSSALMLLRSFLAKPYRNTARSRLPESDHCPVAAALSLADARQALLDQTAPEVGVYKPRLDAAYGLAKSRVANPFLALKPRKTLQFVYLGQTALYGQL